MKITKWAVLESKRLLSFALTALAVTACSGGAGVFTALDPTAKVTCAVTNTTPSTSSLKVSGVAGTITNFNIGYTGALGARFTVNKKLSIWAECNLLSLSLTASEFDVATHTSDNSTANTFPAPGTVIHYKTSGTISATDRMTYSIPYSNIGINAGITYNFVKK